jgi:hypothetical protein
MKRVRCVPILASSRPFGKARILFRLMPKKAPELFRSPLGGPDARCRRLWRIGNVYTLNLIV